MNIDKEYQEYYKKQYPDNWNFKKDKTLDEGFLSQYNIGKKAYKQSRIDTLEAIKGLRKVSGMYTYQEMSYNVTKYIDTELDKLRE